MALLFGPLRKPEFSKKSSETIWGSGKNNRTSYRLRQRTTVHFGMNSGMIKCLADPSLYFLSWPHLDLLDWRTTLQNHWHPWKSSSTLFDDTGSNTVSFTQLAAPSETSCSPEGSFNILQSGVQGEGSWGTERSTLEWRGINWKTNLWDKDRCDCFQL